MLSEIDLSIATLPQEGDEPVVAELVSKSICHLQPPHITVEEQMKLQVDLLFR